MIQTTKTPRAAANPAIALRLQSWRAAGRVAELGWNDCRIQLLVMPERWASLAEQDGYFAHLIHSKNPSSVRSSRSSSVWISLRAVFGRRAGPTSTPSIFMVALAAPM